MVVGHRPDTEASEIPMQIAALIATADRPEILARFALPSIKDQQRVPDYVVVVDDSRSRGNRTHNRNIVNDLRVNGARIIYLPNTRTEGASGAWNTGLEWLRWQVKPPSGLFIALLDDDDEWVPTHLKVCHKEATSRGLDMVACGIRRIEDGKTKEEGRPPDRLDPELFLVGNPNIQGSNLFARLTAFLEAGLFDEHLPSCTDRDLCLRLADLGWVKYGAARETSVRHHADTSRSRLSTPTGEAKKKGLDRFWAKWRYRMTPDIQRDCRARAKNLFNWEPSALLANKATKPPLAVPAKPKDKHAGELVLVVGIISDDNRAMRLQLLLEDLLKLTDLDFVVGLDVVLLENGTINGQLQNTVDAFRARGLTIFFASTEQQKLDAKNGRFIGDASPDFSCRAPISVARTRLQTYAYHVARHREGAVVWILDDDMRLQNVPAEFGYPQQPVSKLLQALAHLHSQGDIAAVLGTVTGDPPVPPGTSVRTQAVDLYHNLVSMSRLSANDALPDRSIENAQSRAIAHDYYYDLSRLDTHHLEWPFWLVPEKPVETVGAAFCRMVAALPHIFSGQEIFRPLLLPKDWDASRSVRPSVKRGANTFIFDLTTLADFPNPAIPFAGHAIRRSDMVWAILNRFVGGRTIVEACIPFQHDRSNQPPVVLDPEQLIADIQGYALYSALEDVFLQRRERRLREGLGAEIPDNLKFTAADKRLMARKCQKYLRERTGAFLLSCWRVRGLCSVLQNIATGNTFGNAFWHWGSDFKRERNGLLDFVDKLQQSFASRRIEQFEEKIFRYDKSEVSRWLDQLPKVVKKQRTASRCSEDMDDWFQAERKMSAITLVQALEPASPLRILGLGSEGVVLTDEATVWKVFDYSKRMRQEGSWDGLEILAGTPRHLTSFYKPKRLQCPGRQIVVSYPFEKSERYQKGGRVGEMLQLLRECREIGIWLSNLHPKNFIVTPSGLRFIDYGSDILPFSEDKFLSMVQRAWLTVQYSHKKNLSKLMREALNNKLLVELEGWEAMLVALKPPLKTTIIDRMLVEAVKQRKPGHALDYGCGKGQVAIELAKAGLKVVGYDPRLPSSRSTESNGTSLSIEWRRGTRIAAFQNPHEKFDAIICSLVLCVIKNEAQWQQVIKHLATLLAPSGVLFLVVCNPGKTFAGDTSFQTRCLPDQARNNQTLVWKKHLTGGRSRLDVHRPRRVLDRALKQSGLHIVSSRTVGGIGLKDFLPGDDFLLLEATLGVNGASDGTQKVYIPRQRIKRTPGSVRVICYHRVLPPELNDDISCFQRRRGTVVQLSTFERHMGDVRRLLQPVSFAAFLEWLDGERELPPNACLVTFDDGYADFAEYAWPVLEYHEIPSVLFVVATTAGPERNWLPVDQLYSILAQAEHCQRLSRADIEDWAQGQRKQQFLHAPSALQKEMLREIGVKTIEQPPTGLYLDEQRLKQFPSDLVSIGGHGTQHEILTNLDPENLRVELQRTRLWIQSLGRAGGSVPFPFAFPNGNHNDFVVGAMIEAGYSAAFTVKPWKNRPNEHRWRYPRSCIPDRMDAIERIQRNEEVRI